MSQTKKTIVEMFVYPPGIIDCIQLNIVPEEIKQSRLQLDYTFAIFWAREYS
jgi:hypothetical protein